MYSKVLRTTTLVYTIFCTVACVSEPTQSATLVGQVKNQSGAGISGASVTDILTGQSTQTDDEGNFTLQGEGSQMVVQAEAAGYAWSKRSIKLPVAGGEISTLHAVNLDTNIVLLRLAHFHCQSLQIMIYAADEAQRT